MGEVRIVRLPDEAATARLAEDVAAMMKPGDVVALSGDLGAGKTSFARAVLRALAADPALDVPSPTFPLRLDYALPRLPVVHADLYRLSHAEEARELGLDGAGEGALLIEWPDRLERLPEGRHLTVALAYEETGRIARLEADGDWAPRLDRSFAARAFLAASGWGDACRTPMTGDASLRAYERIGRDGRSAVLMNAPARAEGPPVHAGRSYDSVAHRALDVRPFVALAGALRGNGAHAPEIFAADEQAGFLLLEDMGDDGIVDTAGAAIPERYGAAIDLLAALHARPWPDAVPAPGGVYAIPPYDRDALLIEISLFCDWFAGQGGRRAFSPSERAGFLADWSGVLAKVEDRPRTLVLRDYHSPNILWRGDAEGLARVGVLDFQDALLGDPAYDVASLAQDARVPLGPELEAELKARYVAARRRDYPAFDADAFDAAYAVFGAQRATKVLGAFVRLAEVAGKPGYRRHVGHVATLLERNLAHPVLSPLLVWYRGLL